MKMHILSRLNIKNQDMFFIFLILPLLEPGLFKLEGYELVDSIYTVFKLLTDFVIVILVLQKKKISLFSGIVILYEISLLVSTIFINNRGWTGFKIWAGPALAAMGICLCFDLFHNLYNQINIINYILFLYITINLFGFLITVVNSHSSISAFEGDGYYFFLGIDNRFIFFFIPFIFCSFIMKQCKNKNNSGFFLFSIIQSVTVLYITWSLGAFLAIAITGLYFALLQYILNGRIFNIKTYLIILLSLNVGIILMVSVYRTQVLELIYGMFGYEKYLSFNHRINIWTNGLDAVWKSPVFGIGITSAENLYSMFTEAAHAHNLVINILVRGGLTSLTLFILIINLVAKEIYGLRDTELGKGISFLLAMSFFFSLTDTFDDVYFWMMLAICYNIRLLHIDAFKKQVLLWKKGSR